MSCEGLPSGVMLIATPVRNGWVRIDRPGQPAIWVRREPGEPTITSIATPTGREFTLAYRDRFECCERKPEEE